MKIKALNAAHPDYDAEELGLQRALAEGGKSFHGVKRTLFPQRANVEPEDVYKERVSLLLYENHAGGMLELVCAMLFAEPPQMDGIPSSPYWTELLEDCDRQGTSWADFWRGVLKDALICECGYAWANLPARDPSLEVNNRAEEEAAGLLDVFLVNIEPEQVINWREDSTGKLQAIMVKDCTSTWLGPDKGTRKVWRWRYIDAEQIRTWTWESPSGQPERPPQDGDEAQEQPPIFHGVGRLPVVRIKLRPALHAMRKLQDPAVRATRARNEHSWALHQSANELLVFKRQWGDGTTPALGHGHYLELEREDSAEYVAPSGVALSFLEKDVAATREELYRALQQMALAADSDATRARMSGESKGQDWKAAEILIAALAPYALKAMREGAEVIAAARGEQLTELTVSGLDGYQQEDLEGWLLAVGLASEARQMSPTFRKVVARREAVRLVGDVATEQELQDIQKEIEDAELDPLGMPLPGGGPPPKPGPGEPPPDPPADPGQGGEA